MKAFLIALLLAAALHAETVTLESGENRTSLLELYTSEGCSSCPPAEAWFSTLQNAPTLWKSFVPVAFHVDYWDSLGWPDRYSSPLFTERQNTYGALWKTTTIYTPEFVLNGREWRRTAAGVPAATESGTGLLRVSVGDVRQVTVSFRPAKETNQSLRVTITPLANGIVTKVRGGENRGRELAHDFVALALLTAPLQRAADGTYTAELTLPKKTTAPISALAAWVSESNSPAPLQAVGGPIHQQRE